MWLYKESIIDDIQQFPEGIFGFVYRIHHLPTNKFYIGRKQLISNKTLPPLKGKKRKRKTQKESNWKTYYSSHPEINNIVAEGREDEFVREILEFAFSPKHLTYLETRYLFSERVLENSDKYWNDNILGKFFRKDVLK
jgi:hypothetical protein